MTPTALAILAWLVEHNGRTGYMPTVREIAAAWGHRSTYSVRRHLDNLEAAGLLVRPPRMARVMRVTPAGLEAVGRKRGVA